MRMTTGSALGRQAARGPANARQCYTRALAGPARPPGGARPGARRALSARAAGAQVVVVDQGCDPGLREAAELASEALTRCCDEGLVACIRARVAPAENTCSHGTLCGQGPPHRCGSGQEHVMRHRSVWGLQLRLRRTPCSARRARGGPRCGGPAAASGQPAALANRRPADGAARAACCSPARPWRRAPAWRAA